MIPIAQAWRDERYIVCRSWRLKQQPVLIQLLRSMIIGSRPLLLAAMISSCHCHVSCRGHYSWCARPVACCCLPSRRFYGGVLKAAA